MKKNLTFFKNSLLGLLFVSLFSFSASAQQWDTVGVAGFSDSTVLHQDLEVHNDTTYVAYRDASNQNKLSVKMYNGSSWVDVGGPNISAGIVGFLDLLVVANNNIYVAYNDGANSNGITVMHYNGTSWTIVGTTIMPSGSNSLGDLSLAYDLTKGIHIAYDVLDYSSPPTVFVDIYVQKIVSGNWVSLGLAGSGVITPGAGWVGRPSLAFFSTGGLLIAYEESYVHVKRYTGSSWVSLGSGSNSDVSSGVAAYADLKIDSNNDIYLAFQDEDNSSKTTVLNYTNSSWVVVGSAGFTSGTSTNQDLAFDNNDNPYISQIEGTSNKDVTVYKLNGTSWTDIGTGSTSAYGNLNHNVGANIEISNGVLYLGLANDNQKATVMKYDLTTSVNQISTLNKEITIYPNPTKAQLTIEGIEGIETIRILTMDGKVMETITTTNNTISVEALPQGIYTIEVITTEGVGYKNFIKQ